MCSLALLFLALGAADAPEKTLFVLANGEEHFGQIVLTNPRTLFLKVGDRIISVAPGDIVDRIGAAMIPREYEKRRAKLPQDAQAHYKLGAWCLKVELLKEAKELLEIALKLDPAHEGAKKDLAALAAKDTTRIPWGDDEAVYFRLEAVVKDGKQWKPDSDTWDRMKNFLVNSKPPFAVTPENDKKIAATYLVRVEIETEVTAENKFYGEVVVSRVWRGAARLQIADPKTKQPRFILQGAEVSDTLEPNDNGKTVKLKALAKLLEAMRANPGFRYGKPPAGKDAKKK